MKNNIILYFFYMLIITLSSCDNKNDIKYKELKASINKMLSKKELLQVQHVIIIPKAGCGGCIDQAIKYLKRETDSLNDVQIIFTGIKDRKFLSLELGEKYLNKPNVHVDSALLFQNIEILSVYPQIVKIKDGEILDVREMDINSLDMKKLLEK